MTSMSRRVFELYSEHDVETRNAIHNAEKA